MPDEFLWGRGRHLLLQRPPHLFHHAPVPLCGLRENRLHIIRSVCELLTSGEQTKQTTFQLNMTYGNDHIEGSAGSGRRSRDQEHRARISAVPVRREESEFCPSRLLPDVEKFTNTIFEVEVVAKSGTISKSRSSTA